MEGLSDSLALELEPFGIRLIVLLPGLIITNWAAVALEHLLETSSTTDYAEIAAKRAEVLKKMNYTRMSSKPEVVAKTILSAINDKKPKYRYPTGTGAKSLMILRKYLGSRTFYSILDRLV